MNFDVAGRTLGDGLGAAGRTLGEAPFSGRRTPGGALVSKRFLVCGGGDWDLDTRGGAGVLWIGRGAVGPLLGLGSTRGAMGVTAAVGRFEVPLVVGDPLPRPAAAIEAFLASGRGVGSVRAATPIRY